MDAGRAARMFEGRGNFSDGEPLREERAEEKGLTLRFLFAYTSHRLTCNLALGGKS